MKHPEFDQMVALAERLRLELDSSDRKNLVGSQIIPARVTGKVSTRLPLSSCAVIALPAPVAVGEENRDGAVGTLVPFNKRASDVQR
jgi:hypothetical protein